MNYNIYDFIGNLGVALIIGSYLLLQLGKLKSNSFIYSFLNGLGALFVIVSLIQNFNLSAMVIEGFWFVISGYGMIKYFLVKQTGKAGK